jgi:hypothetical protein
LVQPILDLGRRELAPLALVASDDDSCGGDAGQTGESECLPDLHEERIPR